MRGEHSSEIVNRIVVYEPFLEDPGIDKTRRYLPFWK